jgi:hypothetical protein
MPGRVVFWLALASVALAEQPLRAQPRGDPQAARYGWISDLEQGRALARKSGKPLMVVIRCLP